MPPVTGHSTWSASLAYLAREGINWPLLESGKLNMQRKTFEEMSKGWPQLEELRQLRHARDKMRKVKLAVGPTAATARCFGRSRPRHHARNRKRRSGFSRRQCGCAH